jgi:hypothetical protein
MLLILQHWSALLSQLSRMIAVFGDLATNCFGKGLQESSITVSHGALLRLTRETP